MLRKALQHGCPWQGFALRPSVQWQCKPTDDHLVAMYAARGGHLDVLRWAREHDCPWDDGTCWSAAEGGHLEVLQWARAHGCPWSKSMCAATSREHPETLAWVRQQPE